MRDWKRLFKQAGKADLYTLTSAAEFARARRAAGSSGLQAFKVDLSHVTDKAAALTALSHSLQFPSYFGQNWDALEECLTDLSWLPAPGYILFLIRVRDWAESCQADLVILREILNSAVIHWKGKGVPFYVILDHPAP